MKTSKGTFTHFKSFKTLFCFIIGKLPQEIVPEVVTDLNVQVVRNSYNPENNDVAPIDHLRSAMSELVEQARFDDFKEMKLDEYRFVHPALLFLDPSQKHLPPSSKKIECIALQVCGKVKHDNSNVKQNSKVKEDNLALFKDITQEVKSLNNIYIAEIKDVSQLADSTIQKEFTQALCLSPIVY